MRSSNTAQVINKPVNVTPMAVRKIYCFRNGHRWRFFVGGDRVCDNCHARIAKDKINIPVDMEEVF